jgi:hypothetical protein
MVHDRYAVTQPLCLIHAVGGEDDGAPRLLQAIHQIPQLTACLGIELRTDSSTECLNERNC